jgi:WD40 repeat protein
LPVSPDRSTLASCSEDKTIQFWDINSGKLKNILPGHLSQFWNINSGELKNTLIGHLSWVNSIVYSPDGSTLASCSKDKTIKLWDINSGEVKIHSPGIQTLFHLLPSARMEAL